MAIANSDGSIVLTTAIDTNGIRQGSNTIRGALSSIGTAAKQTGVKLQDAFLSSKSQKEVLLKIINSHSLSE